ncbi:hypothetical protein [Candidatus Amarobacter glycogenicus]|uniref:hypothetical protein n=1 Tax=Candidatus Amarobacter glycogenicus TaxID=3140699 RepID=UPI0031CC6C68
MTELTPLPPSIESLTPEWLTAALRSGGALPEGSVTAFGHEIIGEGIGFIGTVARLKLQYSGAGPEAPATAIAKLPSEDPGSRMVGVAFGLYEREVRFYSDLAGDCGLPAPKPYFSHYDAGAGQAAIILEDLTGGAFGDQVAGASWPRPNSRSMRSAPSTRGGGRARSSPGTPGSPPASRPSASPSN